MSGFIHCVKFRTPTGYVTGGNGAADASFPHSYAADITHPHRPWKSAGTISIGNTFYGVDFGSAKQLAAVGIDNTNVQSVVLEADDVNTFDSGSLISLIVSVVENPVERGWFSTSGTSLGRLKVFINLSGTDFESQNRRYWRVRAGNSSVDSTEPNFVIGSVAWCQTLTTWASGTSAYDELPLEATRVNDDFAGGGAEPVILGNPYAAITLGATPGDYATMRGPMLELLRQGIGRPFLFYRNAGTTSEFYICMRAGDVAVRTTSPWTIEVNNFIMRSVC